MDAKFTCSHVSSWLNDVRAEMLSCVPTEVGNHLAAARKELLAAARSVIDEEIRWTDRRWEAARTKKAERKARVSEEPAEGEPAKAAKPTK